MPADVLAAHGAVSAETASAMASGVRARLGADVAVSVTGVAGPGGGTEEKPVGLVYLCASGPGGELARDFRITGDRETVRRRATVGRAPSPARTRHRLVSRHVTRFALAWPGVNAFASSALCSCPTRRSKASCAGRPQSSAGGRIVPAGNLHITLAFLGSQGAGELPAIAAALSDAAAGAGELRFRLRGYRETRSVGMLTFDDEGGRGAALAGRLFDALEAIGAYRREARPWLPHLTVLRFRERPRLRAALPEHRRGRAVRRCCFHFPAAPGWGAVRRTRSGSTRGRTVGG